MRHNLAPCVFQGAAKCSGVITLLDKVTQKPVLTGVVPKTNSHKQLWIYWQLIVEDDNLNIQL